MKVVIDTNVIVSAIINPDGIPAKIVNLLFSEKIKIYFDNRILDEYRSVLSRKKFNFDKDDIDFFLEFIEESGENILALPSDAKLKDKSDLKFYEVFLSSNADYLVTGNIKDFESLNEKRIIAPTVFIRKYLGKAPWEGWE